MGPYNFKGLFGGLTLGFRVGFKSGLRLGLALAGKGLGLPYAHENLMGNVLCEDIKGGLTS